MRVDVLHGIGTDPGIFEAQPHACRGADAFGRRLRDVIRVAVGAIADQLGEDRRAAPSRRFKLLEHQHARTLGHDEAVAVFVERAARALGLVVAGRQRTHGHEATDPRRRQACFGAAADHLVVHLGGHAWRIRRHLGHLLFRDRSPGHGHEAALEGARRDAGDVVDEALRGHLGQLDGHVAADRGQVIALA